APEGSPVLLLDPRPHGKPPHMGFVKQTVLIGNIQGRQPRRGRRGQHPPVFALPGFFPRLLSQDSGVRIRPAALPHAAPVLPHPPVFDLPVFFPLLLSQDSCVMIRPAALPHAVTVLPYPRLQAFYTDRADLPGPLLFRKRNDFFRLLTVSSVQQQFRRNASRHG